MGIYIGISNLVGKSSKRTTHEYELFLVLDENTNSYVLFIDLDNLIFNTKY